CDRPRTRLHPDTIRPGVHRRARRNDTNAPRLTTRGDRRGHRLPRLPTLELHHRRDDRRRRRPPSDLAQPAHRHESDKRSAAMNSSSEQEPELKRADTNETPTVDNDPLANAPARLDELLERGEISPEAYAEY